MLRLFGQTDTVFTSNGDCVLRPFKAKVHKKDNSDYYLDLEVSLDYVDLFTEGRIVVANTPTGDQAFRIGNVTQGKSKLVSKCYHVSYDAQNYLIADTNVVNKTCNAAMLQLNGATEPASIFTVFSDLLKIDSFRCVRKSLYESWQTVIEKWGGHIVRDNWIVGVMEEIGQDNGIIIQYKKNLKDITCQYNWNNVVTKLLPVGKDGILLNELDQSASIYLTSSTQYALPYCKTVSFSQDDINEEDYPDESIYKQALVDDLRAQATAYLSENCVPMVNYSLKANLDRETDIGDTIQVIDERLHVDITTKVIGFEYDCIAERYTDVEFGNFTPSLSGLVNTLNGNAKKYAQESSQNVTDEILQIMSKSYVIYDGSSILVVDSLPKESATNVIRIDNTGIGFSQEGITGNQTSKWNIDGTLSLGNDTVADFTKEIGTTLGWNYRKFRSGRVECWRTVTLSPTWSALGSLYSGDGDVSYPFSISNAVVNATVADSSAVWVSRAQAVDDLKTNIGLVSVANSGDVALNIIVYGTTN